MKKLIVLLCLVFGNNLCFSQTIYYNYNLNQKKGDSLFNSKIFSEAVKIYSKNIKLSDENQFTYTRYKLASCWANLNETDSAFLNLDKLAFSFNYKLYDQLLEDKNLSELHSNSKWNSILKKVKKNKVFAETNSLNVHYTKFFSMTDDFDKEHQDKINSLKKQFGSNSKELIDYLIVVNRVDVFVCSRVTEYLNKNGWSGEDEIGVSGTNTLFKVIYQADKLTQETYLPMLKETVNRKKVNEKHLELLEQKINSSK